MNYKNHSVFIDDSFYSHGKIPVLFIHGFTGSSKDWMEIVPGLSEKFTPLLIDLPGHGNSASPESKELYTTNGIIELILFCMNEFKIEKVILAGYSMGGRAALNFAVACPDKVKGMILESATAGIENQTDRNDRKISDEKLADKILSEGIENFVDYWLDIPLFHSLKNLPDEKLKRVRINKLKNNPVGLANSLKYFGSGVMPPVWDELHKLNFPVLLLNGEVDEKYNRINKRMNELLPSSEYKIVKGAGHNIHLEKPADFIILVDKFLEYHFFS